MEEKQEEKTSILQENKKEYSEPELKVVEFTGVPIMADSSRCCYERGMVGYE